MKILLTSDTHYGFSDKTHRIHEKFLNEIKELDFDIMLHAGDWGCNKPDQTYRSMIMFRNHLGNRPIVGVLGNHDYWQHKQHKAFSFNRLDETLRQKAAENNIFLVGRGLGFYTLMQESKVAVLGLDGWYAHPNPQTNDTDNMWRNVEGVSVHQWMQKIAIQEFDSLIDTAKGLKQDGYKLIFLSHFPLYIQKPNDEMYSGNPKWMQFLEEIGFEAMCFGHSHSQIIETGSGGQMIYNAGSDYNNPKYLIFEV